MPQPSPDEITSECIRAIAQAKDLPLAGIYPGTTLEELGLDSLDRVTLSFDLEEKYGIEIPEHRLAAIQSVADIVTEIQSALAKRASNTKPAA